ncbi:sugar phosphate isomerase/epimerase family protein [Fulvivirgaceae bacterium BMA12]|uniref:Sugar phosphate isomerase/epimerase family protein n=1 Tax=Agaribacillus aureus TaxID=3051825 RepID=A0ABT8LAD1_9BACT|nr:sugar phosphate isomerase/epimerase family protein [Fulvivirgaceae bacterium BMA12]
MDRRKFITSATTAGLATAALGSSTTEIEDRRKKRFQNGKSPWPICLDTATIRPADGLEKKVEIAAQAGYDAIEPWDSELADYEKKGGNLKELGKKIKDLGLFVPSMIGLWGCIPENEEAFQKSLPATRNRMRMASEIGCEHVQAIPNKVGENYDLKFVASCYRRLLEIGLEEYNLNPALVFVNLFPLKTMGQATAVVLDADHPQAKIIPDVFHMYITDGGFSGLKLLHGDMFAIFQFNDAPKNMAVKDMKDKHRVYPGDGILPLPDILRDLKATGFSGCVSLELYNPEYHQQDLLQVAKTGLQKTLSVIKQAGV